MAYGRKYTPRKSPRSTPRTPRTPRATPRRNYRKKMPMVSFAKKVNEIIARNVENKFTDTLKYNDGVARTDGSSAYTFFTWTPGKDATGSRLFNIANGTYEQRRIGNTITLKRWIIKGLIQPVKSATTIMENSYIGFVDVYFGKLMKNTEPVGNTLDKLYQNGQIANTPTCLSTDMLNPVNKDKYKVYYHKRFKMGAASDSKTYDTDTPMNVHSANNDFKLAQTFGFDVCKYILKNKHIKYDDITGTTPFFAPNNPDIVNLTIWATWTPQSGQATGASSRSLYSIDCLTYAEYEDA